ncbi:DUF3152 domain-containing protein [Longispora albida]|uniref:DUF3152 domain-containing protein n=1 Tax=Longispora albida TaxID=203523 RepID=UPI00037D67B2|nr:DUF3152 domain-containing protein [Longispora albida]
MTRNGTRAAAAADARAERRLEMMRRRRRTVTLVMLLVAASLVTVDFVRGLGKPDPVPAAAEPKPAVTQQAEIKPVEPKPQPEPSTVAVSPVAGAQSYPRSGPGTFSYAPGAGPILGKSGKLRGFKVAVENESQQDAVAFAAEVDKIFGDARGWTAGGDVRLQRVVAGEEFVIYLATEATSEKMCAEGGLKTDRLTSCRLGGKVIINLSRWLTAVPDYGAPLPVYQAYVLNHETGHQFGFGHERCPAAGSLGPVMLQQTLGMYGCTPNAWPYVDGRRLTGPPGSYTPGN